jgi:hypothetical protein
LITPPTRWFPDSRRQERSSLFLVGGLSGFKQVVRLGFGYIPQSLSVTPISIAGSEPPPKGNSGRLLEVVTTSDILTWDMNPTVDLASISKSDPTFFYTVTNLDKVTGAVVTTYTYVRTE